jgi:hypothetical protein
MFTSKFWSLSWAKWIQLTSPKLLAQIYFYFNPDRKLTWHKHIIAKRKELGITPKSKLFTRNKLLIYKTILNPIWAYGIQLCGTAPTSNIEFLERFQSKALRTIADAPWYVLNTAIRRDPPLQLSIQRSPQLTAKRPSRESHGATRQQQAIAKTPAK